MKRNRELITAAILRRRRGELPKKRTVYDDLADAYALAAAYKKHRDDGYRELSDFQEMTPKKLRRAVAVTRAILQGMSPKEAWNYVEENQ